MDDITPPTADRTEMTQFINDLFHHVMGIRNPPATWTDPWVNLALATGDPLAIFNKFIAGKFNTDRLNALEDTATRWPTGHFYSPVVSRAEVRTEWPRLTAPRAPAAVDMQAEAQRILFRNLARHFDTMPFHNEKDGVHRYYFDNPSYNYGDALIYWSMLNRFKPKRILEVGSGFSSALALDTVDALGLPTVCTFVDPFPEVARAATAPMSPPHAILPIKIQNIDFAILDELGEDDILFIDSSHVVKTGSDVHFEITELLPRIRPGVIVHFHDVFYPFEYRRQWAIEDNHSWNELYFLQAFLMYNTDFRIEFFNHFMARQLTETVHQAAPAQAKRFLLNPGGGLWLRRM